MGSRRKTIPVEVLARVTKFYVSNLPDRCSGADLAKEVRNFGTIFDIYIARKRDRFGIRFGFVSLLDVKDSKEMERVLSAIRMGEFKLKVNVARFVLEEGEVNHRKPFIPKTEPAKHPQEGDTKKSDPMKNFASNSVSFKEAFVGVPKAKTITVDDNLLAFEKLHDRSVVVRVVSLDVLRRIRFILKEMGLGEGSVTCMGGLVILVTFLSGEHAIMAKDELVGRPELFSSVYIWGGQVMSFERIAWLRVTGIPLCVLDDTVLRNIGSFYGSVAKLPDLEELDEDLSFHYVGVVVTQGDRIHDSILLKWRGKIFKIWIEEEHKEWLSNFIEEDEDKEGSGYEAEKEGSDEKVFTPVNSPAKVFSETEVDMETVNGEINANPIDEVVENNQEDLLGSQKGTFKEINMGQGFSGFKNNKRKKEKVFKKVVGLDSGGSNISSNDRPRKEPKANEDPFNLEPFILGLDHHVVKTRGTNNFQGSNCFEVLVQDNQEDGSDEGEKVPRSTVKETPPEIETDFYEVKKPTELEETMAFGEKMGVNLNGFEELILDTIKGEGLQSEWGF